MKCLLFILIAYSPIQAFAQKDTIKIEFQHWENGQLKSQKIFSDLFEYHYTHWHRNGQIYMEGRDKNYLYIYNSWDSLGNELVKNRNGQHIYFYDDGAIKATGQVKQGHQFGIWTTHFPTGEKKAEGPYNSSGRKEGNWFLWNQQGNKIEEQKCTNNYCETWNQWDEDGQQIITEGNGFLTNYYSNGQKESAGNLKQRKKTGDWKYWFRNGQEQLHLNYTNQINPYGHSVSNLTYQAAWDSLGNQTLTDGTGWVFNIYGFSESSKTYLKNGLRDSLSISYFENGNPHYVDTYNQGLLTHRTIYHDNGNKAYESYDSNNTIYFYPTKNRNWTYQGRLYKESLAIGYSQG